MIHLILPEEEVWTGLDSKTTDYNDALPVYSLFITQFHSYHFDQLRYGDLKLHCDRVGHIFNRSDELVVPPEQPPKQSVLRLG